MATARIVAAVLHGVTVVLLYLACRQLRVGRQLAWLPGLAYVVVCQPAWPIASQHWLSTLLHVLLLVVCIDVARGRATAMVVPGIVLGLLIAVHQQRGLVIAAGVVCWMVLDAFLQRRYWSRPAGAPLIARLGALAAGTLAVGVPLAAATVARAGFEPVWHALVVHPWVNYRAFHRSFWGHVTTVVAFQASYTFPLLLKFLPAILVVSGSRWLALLRLGSGCTWARGRAPEEASRLTLLIIFCLFSIWSVWYYPDFIHVAFIAPVFFVTITESLDWLLARVRTVVPFGRSLGWSMALALVLAAGIRLYGNWERLHRSFAIRRETAFGRIDFGTQLEADLYDQVNALMKESPARDLYCYPHFAHLYLLTDSHNPTRFGFLQPGYSSPEQLDEVVRTLTDKQPPYVVVIAVPNPKDPVLRYITDNYEPIPEDGQAAKAIYRRRRAT